MKLWPTIANIDKKNVLLLFLLAVIAAALPAFFVKLPSTDIFEVYAPAAEAFARGDMKYAFHPRTGVFFPALSGVFVFLFDCTGVAGCQAAAILLFALSVFPLFALFRYIWDRPTAFAAVLLTIITSHLIRHTAEGLRDGGKLFALALMIWGIAGLTKENKKISCCAGVAVGAALLTVLRGEGGMIALCGCVYACFLVKEWKRIIFSLFLFILLILPQCIYNYNVIGYPVPELRYGVLMKKIGIETLCEPEVVIPESAK